jgi:hypothetical protein
VIDAHGRGIGRIFKARAGVPEGFPWMWTITGAVVASHLPSHGFCATREEAQGEVCRDVARVEGLRRSASLDGCDGRANPGAAGHLLKADPGANRLWVSRGQRELSLHRMTQSSSNRMPEFLNSKAQLASNARSVERRRAWKLSRA